MLFLLVHQSICVNTPTYPMMKFLSLLSLAAVAGGFGLCSSVMGEDLSLPPLRLAIRTLEMKESPHIGPVSYTHLYDLVSCQYIMQEQF